MSTITRAEQTNSFFNDSIARNKIVKEAKSRGFVQMSPFCNDSVIFHHSRSDDVKVRISMSYDKRYPIVETLWSQVVPMLTKERVELHSKATHQAAKLMKSIESIIHTVRLTKIKK